MAFEGMPGYDLINVVRELGPVEAVRDQEAAERMRVYPKIVGAGPPDFGVAEQRGGEWRILTLGAMEPAGARIDLAIHLRETSAGRRACVRREMLAIADRLDPEVGEADTGTEFRVGGGRFRIVRTLGFTRFGDDGPEPARATDTEEGPVSSFLIDPTAPVGPAGAALRLELLSLVPAAGTVPEELRREAVAAIRRHPGVVLLPPEFTVVEDLDDRWRPLTGGEGPQDARDALAHYFRVILPRFTPPGMAPPSPGELEEYARAADHVETGRGVEFVACGRRFRVVRVVRMIRVGPDGPEPARPSDEEPDAD
ncbi:DUF5954 family protein [Actinomadura rubrisoli]|uniref:PE-PGRS family protein n=1 Tax=Actinomadura rubrisoli TaxID=2530368 RepID=A0A4R5CCC8_9ACTN|nr:DUF5954 family protein [Actinomadura rubrisoli]TDD94772.1 hypothetical protein E1298_06275 [Actinomadura rubrisoli]